MDTTNLSKLTQEFMSAYNSHDIEKTLSLYTDDCVVEQLGTGVAIHGKQEYRKNLSDLYTAFPDLKIEFKTDLRSGDFEAYEWVLSGTHKGTMPASENMPELPPTNKKFSLQGATINLFRDNKVSRETDYWNVVFFMQQLGLMPANPGN